MIPVYINSWRDFFRSNWCATFVSETIRMMVWQCFGHPSDKRNLTEIRSTHSWSRFHSAGQEATYLSQLQVPYVRKKTEARYQSLHSDKSISNVQNPLQFRWVHTWRLFGLESSAKCFNSNRLPRIITFFIAKRRWTLCNGLWKRWVCQANNIAILQTRTTANIFAMSWRFVMGLASNFFSYEDGPNRRKGFLASLAKVIINDEDYEGKVRMLLLIHVKMMGQISDWWEISTVL